jgi:ribonuclease HII
MTKTLGIDEVGRGAWAGPMVVGAVILGSATIAGLKDSKKLTAKQREKLAYDIKNQAAAVATGWVTSGEIDALGLSAALKLAARRAVAKIETDFDEMIIDGTIKLVDDPRAVTLPKADGLVQAVSAASIVAKVARDMYMAKLADKYPQYGFEKHVGYGTAQHRTALDKHGTCSEHRRSFAPIKTYSNDLSAEGFNPYAKEGRKNTTKVGLSAEDVAAEYLVDRGHIILERNWKTKICEIDIVSQKEDGIYFTEVKYRGSDRGGGGIEAIDSQKERQMRFAAEVYLEFNEQFKRHSAFLSALSLTNKPPQVEHYIPNIDD